MFVLFYHLFGILRTAFEEALENAFLRVICSSNVMSFIDCHLQVTVQQHHGSLLSCWTQAATMPKPKSAVIAGGLADVYVRYTRFAGCRGMLHDS